MPRRPHRAHGGVVERVRRDAAEPAQAQRERRGGDEHRSRPSPPLAWGAGRRGNGRAADADPSRERAPQAQQLSGRPDHDARAQAALAAGVAREMADVALADPRAARRASGRAARPRSPRRELVSSNWSEQVAADELEGAVDVADAEAERPVDQPVPGRGGDPPAARVVAHAPVARDQVVVLGERRRSRRASTRSNCRSASVSSTHGCRRGGDARPQRRAVAAVARVGARHARADRRPRARVATALVPSRAPSSTTITSYARRSSLPARQAIRTAAATFASSSWQGRTIERPASIAAWMGRRRRSCLQVAPHARLERPSGARCDRVGSTQQRVHEAVVGPAGRRVRRAARRAGAAAAPSPAPTPRAGRPSARSPPPAARPAARAPRTAAPTARTRASPSRARRSAAPAPTPLATSQRRVRHVQHVRPTVTSTTAASSCSRSCASSPPRPSASPARFGSESPATSRACVESFGQVPVESRATSPRARRRRRRATPARRPAAAGRARRREPGSPARRSASRRPPPPTALPPSSSRRLTASSAPPSSSAMKNTSLWTPPTP